jgi:lipid-A-disaccharide synthase-like uncharacterized protein
VLDVVLNLFTDALRPELYHGLLFRAAWLTFGFTAQGMFFGRFLVQWLASERAGQSYIPLSFWWLSIAGSLMLLTYAIFHLHDPVIIVGQSTGAFIYVRNLLLIRKKRKAQEAAGNAAGDGESDERKQADD